MHSKDESFSYQKFYFLELVTRALVKFSSRRSPPSDGDYNTGKACVFSLFWCAGHTEAFWSRVLFHLRSSENQKYCKLCMRNRCDMDFRIKQPPRSSFQQLGLDLSNSILHSSSFGFKTIIAYSWLPSRSLTFLHSEYLELQIIVKKQ